MRSVPPPDQHLLRGGLRAERVQRVPLSAYAGVGRFVLPYAVHIHLYARPYAISSDLVSLRERLLARPGDRCQVIRVS